MVMATTCIAPFGSATAHNGHVGEVAGHGHLVGIGLIAASAVLAGWLTTHDHGHHHHPYPHAKHPHGPESVRNRKPVSDTKGK